MREKAIGHADANRVRGTSVSHRLSEHVIYSLWSFRPRHTCTKRRVVRLSMTRGHHAVLLCWVIQVAVSLMVCACGQPNRHHAADALKTQAAPDNLGDSDSTDGEWISNAAIVAKVRALDEKHGWYLNENIEGQWVADVLRTECGPAVAWTLDDGKTQTVRYLDFIEGEDLARLDVERHTRFPISRVSDKYLVAAEEGFSFDLLLWIYVGQGYVQVSNLLGSMVPQIGQTVRVQSVKASKDELTVVIRGITRGREDQYVTYHLNTERVDGWARQAANHKTVSEGESLITWRELTN